MTERSQPKPNTTAPSGPPINPFPPPQPQPAAVQYFDVHKAFWDAYNAELTSTIRADEAGVAAGLKAALDAAGIKYE